jgi:hypothetical protein
VTGPGPIGTQTAGWPGTLPWSGSRARTRDIGYGEAMHEVAMLVHDLKRGPLDPAGVLKAVVEYANAAHLLSIVPALTPDRLDWWGDWDGRQAAWYAAAAAQLATGAPAVRSIPCPLCGAEAGPPCTCPPAGDHVARWALARRQDLITAEQFGAAMESIDVITDRAMVTLGCAK